MAEVTQPTVMPVDREIWKQSLHLSNFVNAYCQFRDIAKCGEIHSLLIVGPGQGLDTAVFRWRGYKVTTFDIDATFAPDVIGSCHDMAVFADKQFDAVIASHVIEHLPIAFLDRALGELARVARNALIYVPVAGRKFQLRMSPGVKALDCSLLVDYLLPSVKPDPEIPRFCGGQHFWELGVPGFKKADLLARLAVHFDVLDAYRNRDWTPSYNFVLRSRESRLT